MVKMEESDWKKGYLQAYQGQKYCEEGVKDTLGYASGRVEGESDRLSGRESRLEEEGEEEEIGPK